MLVFSSNIFLYFLVGSWTLENCHGDPSEVWCSVILLHTYSVSRPEFAQIGVGGKMIQHSRGETYNVPVTVYS